MGCVSMSVCIRERERERLLLLIFQSKTNIVFAVIFHTQKNHKFPSG